MHVAAPKSFELAFPPGAVEGSVWVWFGPHRPRTVWLSSLAALVLMPALFGALGALGAQASALLGGAVWAGVFLSYAAHVALFATVGAVLLFRGRRRRFRLTSNQVRLGRFALPLDTIGAIEVWDRPHNSLPSRGLLLRTGQGTLLLEVCPFRHGIADLHWLAGLLSARRRPSEIEAVPSALRHVLSQASRPEDERPSARPRTRSEPEPPAPAAPDGEDGPAGTAPASHR